MENQNTEGTEGSSVLQVKHPGVLKIVPLVVKFTFQDDHMNVTYVHKKQLKAFCSFCNNRPACNT